MVNASLLVGIALLVLPPEAPADPSDGDLAGARPLQLTIGAQEKATCRPAPARWDLTAKEVWVAPAAASDDLRRYFDGLSFQATTLLPAAWHGRVRFCRDSDERVFAGTLAEVVIRRAPSLLPTNSDLPGGAAELLTAFASPVLEERLVAFDPASSEEEARKAEALSIVRHAVTGGR